MAAEQDSNPETSCDTKSDGPDLLNTFESKAQAARTYAQYMQKEMSRGVPLTAMSRHLIGFFQQQRGARQWRRTLSSIDRNLSDATGLVEKALAAVEPQTADGELSAQTSPAAMGSEASIASTAGQAAPGLVARN